MRLPSVGEPDVNVPSRQELERRIAKLEKINAALMQRVERSMDQQANAYSMFQTAIGLETQVRIRTEELKSALAKLELANDELTHARDTAERANNVKTRFFTAVSHDVLQPLHAAQLSLSALIEGADAGEQRQLALQVDHALASIEDLLRTLLDLSKLEAGVIQPSIEATALEPVFQSLVVDMAPLVRAKGLRMTCRSGGFAVMSDALMLRRILQNLLANALNYTRAGGILLGARRRGGDVRIEIWDSGPGIPEAERSRIFEEFQRGSTSTGARTGGFGLGLSIVTRMAQTLDHPLGMCTRVGHGTLFTLTAPRAEAQPVEPAPEMEQRSSSNAIGIASSSVLVLDNDPLVLDSMRALLGRWSCQTRAARSLADVATLIAEGFRPDIVLADYHLDHGERGTQAIRLLRQSFGPRLPAIVITADRAPGSIAEASALGCELLFKPVRPAELRALMQHLLN